MKSGNYAYRDRKAKARFPETCGLPALTPMTRMNGMSYSTFISGLKKNGVEVNRKVLADIAVRDESGFADLVAIAK